MSSRFLLHVDRLLERRPRLIRFLCAVAGAATVLSFAPFGWYPLAVLLLVPVLLFMQRASPRDAFKIGFCFGAGLFLSGTYWLYISIHVFGNAPLFLAIALMLALVFIMALYYGLCGWLVSRMCQPANGSSVSWRFLLVAPAVWVTVEWLRGWLLTGFPWMTLGYSQTTSLLGAFAPVVGVFGVSFAIVLSAAALAAALSIAGRQRIVLLGLAIAPWLVALPLQSVQWTEPAGNPQTATVVQGGISQDRKWLAEQFAPTLELYRASLQKHADSDIVVWPEVAIPALLDQVERYVLQLQDDLADGSRTLLFGILEREPVERRVFNSFVALDGSTRQIYRKRHLVPFGEYFPVPQFVRDWMRTLDLPYTDLSAGDRQQPLIETHNGQQLAVAICYEDAYGAEQLDAFPEAGVLVNVSNDAWFGDSIAPHQHLQIAQMRAREVGRPVIRATNTGISGFIDADGALLARGEQFVEVALTRDVQPRRGMTPYAMLGNWPTISLCVLILIVVAWRRKTPSLP